MIGKQIRKIRKKINLKLADEILIKHVDEVGICIVLKCNLNCVMCHQAEIKCKPAMTFEKFRKILINLKKDGVTKISIVGGEIFVLDDVWKFISLMARMKFKYDLSTNLFNIPNIEKFKQLKELEMVTTSIDGLEEIHNKIRRNPQAFQNVVMNIKKLVKMKVSVDVACVVQRANIDTLEDITKFICGIGVKSLSFLIENKITAIEREQAIIQLKKLTGAKANFYLSTMKNSLGELTKEDIKKFPRKVSNIKRIVKKYGAKASFATQLLNPKIMDKKTSLENFTCSLFNGYSSYVYEDGNFNTCGFSKLEGEKFDLSKNTPLKILNSGEYIKIRKRFKKFGATEKCRYCCAIKRKN